MHKIDNGVFSLNIGLTNRCNARCVFCPVSKTSVPRIDMPDWLMRKVVDETVYYVRNHISLALFGESTLSPLLANTISHIKRKRAIPVILYTNGVELNDGLIEQMVLYGLDKLTISLDAFSPAEYKEIKGIDRYSDVVDNIVKIAEMKRKHQKTSPEVVVQFAALNYSVDAEAARRFLNRLEKYANRIKFSRFISWGDEVKWVGSIERKIRGPRPCKYVFDFLNVASDGEVVLCCMDYNHLHGIGNASKDNVMDIWEGEKFGKIREAQLNGNFDLTPICLKCENKLYA